MKNIYFDNNATTKVAPEVLDAMLPMFKDYWGNPSSMHFFGGNVKKHLDAAREQAAALIGADPSEIFFTSCGTESDNTAIRGVVEAHKIKPRLITTRVEHPAVLEPFRFLRGQGFTDIELEVDSKGQLNLEELNAELKKGPAFVSIMWANNETGVVFPIKQIAEAVKSSGSIMHTDAVQAVGKMELSVKDTPVDMLTFSGHKIHAPKGVGVLYIRKGVRMNPLLFGGHQESGKRGGTENTPGIVGLGKACELAASSLVSDMDKVAQLRNKLESGLIASVKDSQINGDLINRLPNTTNISFQYVEGEAILYHCSDAGIAASSGSACALGSLEPSHVIRAMGVPFTMAHGSIRFSLSRYNTMQEVDYALETVPGIIAKLRAMSPFGH
ncbi:MAG: cysteine desulfurase NifS [Lentisphaerae bacterium]|nr:cysteine desulfurase NifS [Lentisphaerota bacterium]